MLATPGSFQTWKVPEVTGGVWVNHWQMEGSLNLWVGFLFSDLR